jgi:hypothetical protein
VRNKAAVFVVIVVVAGVSFAAGMWTNEARQGSSKPSHAATTTTSNSRAGGSTETAEFCTTYDEPSPYATSNDSWHWNSLDDCLEMDR